MKFTEVEKLKYKIIRTRGPVFTIHTLGKFVPVNPNQAPNHESLDGNGRSVLRPAFHTFGERTPRYLVSLTVDMNGKHRCEYYLNVREKY